jgi:hypothetical protein
MIPSAVTLTRATRTAVLAIVGAAFLVMVALPATSATEMVRKLPFRAKIIAPNNDPIANKSRPITIKVTDLKGKPIRATLTMRVTSLGVVVGKIDNGKIYHFVGRHHEKITWPVASIGQPIALQAVVKAKGKTRFLSWPIHVKK